jgi:hypothetical protein
LRDAAVSFFEKGKNTPFILIELLENVPQFQGTKRLLILLPKRSVRI